MRFIRVAIAGLSTLLLFFLFLLKVLFGRISWTPPGWLPWVTTRFGRIKRGLAARPRLAVGLAVGIVLLGVGGYQGYVWWQARPRPVLVRFTVTHPPRTDLEHEKPPSPLLVTFDRSVAPLAQVGKEVTSGIQITPILAGTWRWSSDRRLEFEPKDDWPIGAEYSVVLDKSTVAPQVRLAEYQFKFQAPPFVIRITTAQFHQDPTNPTLKKAVIDLNFSHPVNPAELERRIELRFTDQPAGILGIGRKTTKFTVTYDKLKLNAYIHSESLPIPKDDTTLSVTIDKGVVAARGGKPADQALAQTIAVPGLYSLHLSDFAASVVTNERNEPEQVIVLQTSAAVHEKEVHKAVSAWVLPLYHPASKPEARTEPHPWSDPAEITDAILKLGTKLALEPIAAEREHVETHSFKYRADVGRYLYLQVDKGLRSFGGYLLGERVQRIMRVPAFPPELKILSQGALLTMSGERKIAVLVRDLPGVRIDIGRLLPSQLQHLVSQAGGNFSNPEFYETFGPDNLTERFERKVPLPKRARGRAHYQPVDLSEYLKSDGTDRRGVFLLTVQSYDPAKEQKPPRGAPRDPESEDGETPERDTDAQQLTDKRLVLVTDLGILAKRALDGDQDVFVQSIHSGAPVAGATVEVIAKNGAALFSQTTDSTGRARFPKLDGLSRERSPLMYLVRKGGDLSFLPLNRRDRGLDFSRFDVGGIQNARVPDQLTAYLFSDRGIYRPGDAFHIGVIVKAADWTKSVVGLPLEAEVLDSRGLTVKREKLTLGSGGFSELAHTTLETSPTGTYTVNLYIVKDGKADQQIGSTTVKVQEFLPDRMKVGARLSRESTEGWVSPEELKARVTVQNLFGTPAEKRRVEATLTLRPAFPAFPNHPDYHFYDAQRAKEGYRDRLADGTTDERGEVEFDLRLERYAKATYRLHFLARAFELEGGRSVTAETATLVSELPFLVGFKPDGALEYVSRGAKRTVSLIAIDPQAKKTGADALVLHLVDRAFVSVLTRQPNGTYKYESRKKEVLLRETPLRIPADGLSLALATDRPGNFAYVIRDRQGLELNRVEYSVAGRGQVTRSLERNAELQLSLNKKEYAPGEEIEISIRAPYTGAGLISIERDRVYAHQWFKTTTPATVQRIRLPKDFEGNGYASVQFIRDPASDEIFMSPLSYGITPFRTSLAQRTNALTLTAPEMVKPGQKLRLSLTAAQPARAVVFVVDEGILQVARYQPPDPLGHFFQKRKLEVRTSQILDLILPEFQKLMLASAPGGDREGELGRHLNPFKRKRDKPVVFWSGIVTVKGTREFVYQVPDYFNGSLRVLAVTVNDGTLGAAQTKSLVRGDFVLSPNTPGAVAPGDEFDVSVGIANNVRGAGPDATVAVSLTTTPHLAVIGSPTQQLKIGELREGVALFRLQAKEGADARLGSATLTFGASLGTQRSTLDTDVSIRPATPHYTLVAVGSFTGSTEVPVQRVLHSEHRYLEAGVSPVPLILAVGLSSYLADFRHVCTEQIVSQAIPLVVLANRPEFGRAPASAPRAARTLEVALGVLRTRQNAEGGFGAWTASVQAEEFASVYAVHLLLEAHERGERIPPDMLQKGLAYLQQLAATPARDLWTARVRAYAAYLLTRQGIVTTPLLAGLRDTLDTKAPKEWPQDLVAAYLAASYQLLKQERLAATLIQGPLERLTKADSPYRYEEYYDPLVRDTQTLYLLARHFPQRAKALPTAALTALVKPIQEGRFHTLSAAYTILALDAYAAAVGPATASKLSIAEIDRDGKATPLALPTHLMPRVPFSPNAAKLRFGNAVSLTTFYSVTESGFDRVPPDKELKSGIEVIREYLDSNGAPVTSAKLGDELTVRLRFRAIDRGAVRNVALVDLLPGGFEPVLAPPGEAVEGAARPAWTNRVGRGGSWGPDFADVREDRVVFYGTVGSGMAEYTYRIKATNGGRFVVPPAYAESLYERSVQARSLPGRIVVERPGK